MTPDRVDHWRAELDRLSERGIHCVTLADDAYPSALRMVPDCPPLLFMRGSILHADSRAIAIVGTRKPSADGIAAATALAHGMADAGITVVSGLADGIDTAAHRAALESGGRTIAVFGTGIERVHPATNRQLAESITEHGAVVSQFLPTQAGARWSFPVRNIVTSGLSAATVVVEAGEQSGSRIQAERAIDHGRRVYLFDPLVAGRSWAVDLLERGLAQQVRGVDEVIDSVVAALDAEATAVF